MLTNWFLMDVTKSSGSSGARRGQHGEGHSEGVNDDLYGHCLVPETVEGVHASMLSLRYLWVCTMTTTCIWLLREECI